jgi:phenylalanyl-tRNA synthetase beta chain
VMRTSLLPGLLAVVARARRHGERDVRVFHVGSLFAAAGAPPTVERTGFAAILGGEQPAWLGKPQAVDVWDAKGLAEGMIRRLLRRETALVRASDDDRPKHLHPRASAFVEVEGKRVGALGPLHPEVAGAFEVGDGAMVVELDLDELAAVGARPAAFTALPRFPASLRDIAVVVADEVTAGDVERAVREAAGDLAERVTLFDRFSGGAIAAGHASLGLHVVYRARDRTLTDAEIDARHAQVVAQIQKQFGGRLRA